MSNTAMSSQAALKYELEVQEHGRVELTVPFAPGRRVVVFVIEEPPEEFSDLMTAARSSLAFWDNPIDDEEWNAT